MAVQNITGNVVDVVGTAYAGAVLKIRPVTGAWQNGAQLVFGEETTVTADGSGDVDFNLETGSYKCTITLSYNDRYLFAMIVGANGPYDLPDVVQPAPSHDALTELIASASGLAVFAGTPAEGRAALGLGSAATQNTSAFATAEQGGKADTAVQPGDLGTAASQNSSAFATAAQGEKADSAIQPGNAALTNAREWTGETVDQAEAEAGTATTRRAWTAQRVRQAAAAWWAASSAKAALDAATAAISALSPVATSGAYSDLSGRPTLGTAAAAAATDFATAAQGGKADSAVQPAALAAEAAARTLADVVAGRARPGEFPEAYRSSITGDADAGTLYTSGDVVEDSQRGAVIELDAATHVAARQATPIEPGRVYSLRVSIKRATNPSDPLNDAVQYGVRWLQADLTGVSGGSGNREIDLDVPLVAADGWQDLEKTLSLDVEGVDYTIPSAAVFGDPWVRTYGVDHVTRIARVDLIDITSAWVGLQAEEASEAAVAAAETATTQAGIATTQAGVATTQAGIAVAAADDAQTSRDAAAAIVGAGNGQGATGSAAAPFWSFLADPAAGFFSKGGGVIGIGDASGGGEIGPVGPLPGLLAAASEADARRALAMDARRPYYPTAGRSYPVFARDAFPCWHYVNHLHDQTIRLDLAGLSLFKTYAFVNGGKARAKLILDVGEESWWVAPHLDPDNVTTRFVTIWGGESAFVIRLTTGPFVLMPFPNTGFENVGGGWTARADGDGTYTVEYTRAGTSTISAGGTTTVTMSSSLWSFDTAVVEGFTPQPTYSGGVPVIGQPLPLQLSAMGTPGGLSSHQVQIHNPNASAWNTTFKLRIKGVTRS